MRLCNSLPEICIAQRYWSMLVKTEVARALKKQCNAMGIRYHLSF
jgi:hypothetical protein